MEQKKDFFFLQKGWGYSSMVAVCAQHSKALGSIPGTGTERKEKERKKK